MDITLLNIGNGEKFENVPCILKEFKKSRDTYEIVVSDSECTRYGYVKANLFSYEQLQGFVNKVVTISGLHEAGLEGVVPEKIKVKNIVLKPQSSTDEDALKLSYHIEDAYLDEYEKELLKYATAVGNFVPGYRELLKAYLTKDTLKRMRTMPATHVRQGSPFGGMLHATYTVVKLVYQMGITYISCANGLHSFKEKRALNWDLLLTAAILHLAGNFLYFDNELPHSKTTIGIEQGFSMCRQQYILSLISKKGIQLSQDDIASLFGVMARLNEQHDGVKKCRQEAILLNSAYHLFCEMDKYDYASAKYIESVLEEHKNDDSEYEFTQSGFLDSIGAYVSKDELVRKSNFIKTKKEQKGEKKHAV